MGYAIFTDLRLEALIRTHLDQFRAGFFGERPLIVVQSQSLAQWLKLHLADALGGWATGDLVFQDEALRRLIDLAEGALPRPLFLDELKFALYPRLEAALGPGGDPVFLPLRGTNGSPSPQRLFELADHIAGVFHQYAMNSEVWPRALTEGVVPAGLGADPATFAWQSALWRGLWADPEVTLAGLLLERLARTPPRGRTAPRRLVVVGSAFLSRRALAFLRSWADAGVVDVTHLLLVPGTPATLATPPGRPWTSWGTFGRAFLDRLPPAPEAAPPPQTPTNALARLQRGLAGGQPFGGPADPSLRVFRAPHPLRELENVRDRLLETLAADPTLQLHEIALLAPDINVYAPFFDAVFASDDPGRRLRYHVIDLDLGRENPWFQTLDALLAILSGPLDRPKLFRLADAAPFAQTWGLSAEDRELWLDYTDEVGAWRDDGPWQSWAAGADRLFEGWFRPQGDPGAPPPLSSAGSTFRALGRLHQLLDELADWRADVGRDRPFEAWVAVLDQLVGRYLGDGEGTAPELAGRLRTLGQGGDPARPWPWAGFRAFLQDQIAHFPGRRGQLLTEGIHCSSLRPLRAIPFRVIAVVGLDEGSFPRRPVLPAFDLMRHEPGQAEVSSLAVDRYTFWETLGAARDRLILSYPGISPVDGSPRPPSGVLSDLLDGLETGQDAYPVTDLGVKDFSPRGEGPTWSPRTHRRTLALVGPPATSIAPPEAEVDPEDAFPEVRASEVVDAFVRPARFHLRRVRQITLKQEDRRGLDDEEPWSLGFFERHGWLDEALRRYLSGFPEPWDAQQALVRAQALGRVRPGVFAQADLDHLQRRATQVRAWADGWLAAGWKPAAAAAPGRTRWAGRPWAAEPELRLEQPGRRLVPRLGYSATSPFRSRVDAALRYLQEPGPDLTLAILGAGGEAETLHWKFDAEATRALGAEAEAYWTEATRRPLLLYPDLIEALGRGPEDGDWASAAQAAWRQRWDSQHSPSEALLVNDPYVALVQGDDEVPPTLAADLERWWEPLWKPLREAWE